ncbi:branched-chain amino acid ABC transporter permease [Acidimangrovimonas sediminis]|uniref:branched-chain amino acid ABC transporter permease n=1 Tax=Acidimangrovimonas sediminis TaxID=2056283 RepID=UPI000C801595|nr:branched-chain amino acid ABC transporter permease [Acidimangrovimonas sediminis]
MRRDYLVHGALLAALLVAHFLLPAYHHGVMARVMVLACFAIGYNVLFGYTGLLSLGHALFFAAGMYGAGMPMHLWGTGPGAAFAMGVLAATLVALVVGALALRTAGVAFMIVTLMFAQAGYLALLLASRWTGGDQGIVIAQAQRQLWSIDLSAEGPRYLAALVLFGVCLIASLALMRSRRGRVLIAIRENEERARLLGYDTFAMKLMAVTLSGTFAGVAGAGYGILFGYVGASFATVQYSIYPLLWVLLGGAGTILGPFLGTLFMYYLVDTASDLTSAYLLVVGVVLILLTLFAPGGIGGELRRRLWRAMP